MGSIATIQTSPNHFTITVSGTIVEGEIFKVLAVIYDPFGRSKTLSRYVAVSGDGINEVVAGLYAFTDTVYKVSISTTYYTVDLSSDRGYILSANVTEPTDPTAFPVPEYNLKYLCTFDPVGEKVNDPVYRIEILEKNYEGEAMSVTGGDVPAVHRWESDNPKEPIRGSSLAITLVNEGTIPLSVFYSTDDDQFKVRLYYQSSLLFEGFLVQDDCTETMVDFEHYINLSANDNLGLLKDVSLDQAYASFQVINSNLESYYATAPHTLWVGSGLAVLVQVGDVINLLGGTYTVVDTSGGNLLIVAEDIPTLAPGTTTITLYRKIATNTVLFDRKYLIDVITTCLRATGLQLDLNVFAHIYEASQDADGSTLSQTMIDLQTFLSDTKYDDCYTVLTKLLTVFKMTLFQAKGVWNIIRWDELRQYGNAVPGYTFNIDGNYTGSIIMDAVLTAGVDEPMQAETGLIRKILRPFLSVKETFNYKQPAQILRNFDLQELGAVLNTYTTGSGVDLRTITEYEAKWFDPSTLLVSTTGTYFIRVTQDNVGNEIERVLVLNGDVKGFPIEVNEDDAFKFSFTFKTEDSQPGNLNLVMIVELFDGSTTNYLHEDTGWETGVGWVYNIPSGDNSNQWHSVTIDSTAFPIPFSGLLYCYLRVADLSAPINETYYKDIRFEYIPLINKSTKIIGHTHENSQNKTIKQKEDIEIFVDSSPRNSIAGTLFLNTSTGILLNRTNRWKTGYDATERRLGEIVTHEHLYWRKESRTILEGDFYGIISGLIDNPYNVQYSIFDNGDGTQTVTFTFDSTPPNTASIKIAYFNGTWAYNLRGATSPQDYTMPIGGYLYRLTFVLSSGAEIIYNLNPPVTISLLSVIQYTWFQDYSFAWGLMEIDYKNGKVTGTLWEMWRGSGISCQLYTFAGFGFPVGAWSISGILCDGTPFSYSSISGSGTIPTEAICAQVGTVTTVGNITVTEGLACGPSGSSESPLVSNYLFKYLYSEK